MRSCLSYLLVSFLFLSSCKPEEPTRPPNIIMFMVDDMGWQDTSVPFWSQRTPFNERYHTPNMERLASQGMKFTQAYATPVCSPTRVSLMTGMNAARHRVTNWTLDKDVLKPAELKHERLSFPLWNVNGMTPDSTVKNAVYATPLPSLMRNAGYHTIHVGKAHLGAIDTPAANPENIGFDVNIAGHAAGAPQSFWGIDNFGNTEKFKDTPWPVPGLEKYHGQDIYLTEALTQEAIAALNQPLSKRQPFFLYMSLYAVHAPIMENKQYVDRYYKMGLDSIEAKYASMVESMDQSLGALMDFIAAQNIDDQTVILFMSDNGGLSVHARGGERNTHNKPLASGKGSIREGGIREPMIVKWPEVTKPNSINPNYLIIEDFYPTILEIAGVVDYQTAHQIDGESFVSMLKDNEVLVQTRPLFWHFPNEWGPKGPGIGAFSAVRRGDWKLVYWHLKESFELYNIVEDIGETSNVAENESALVVELATLLTEYLKSVDAQMPMHKPSGEKVTWPSDKLTDQMVALK
ncbi:MAG: sulfatase [Bacteroidetes bacterium]|nr:sulfatase [Bacteroidota bacterium]MDA1122118.1 sulfatase [Bacteroidota bacterium]